MDKFLGRTLEGRYLIEELIGVGGMANVYRGFDRLEHRPVAVKILRDEYSQNDEFLRRFRDESRAIYSLNHPNIVKIYDAILDTRNPTIVMEYVNGITVRDYIDSKGMVGIRIAVSLTLQLLRALQHAHDNGIVHRDIKPQNIMVPGDGSIKVMDFGIARFAMSQSRTITSLAIGSVHYTSPEQARGDAVIDHRSDIYSAGVILYEMLTGQLPFEGDNPVAVAMKQIEERPLSPSELNPNIPLGLSEIVLRAMAKHADDRYQSASEMIYDIEQFADNPELVFGYQQRASAPAYQPEPLPGPVRQNGGDMTKKTTRTEPKTERRKAKARRPISFLAVLFGITMAFVLATAGFVGYMFYTNNPFEQIPEVEMPSLVGKQYESVIKDSQYSMFKFELVEQQYNPSYVQGEIYEQYPTSGKQVKEGITIKLKVSNGNQTVTLPSFADEEATLVLAKLTEMGLVGEQQLVGSDNVPEGYVVGTEPGPNESLPMGSTVILHVSQGSGKQKVTVPDVTGQDIETAREMLQGKGLQVGTVTRSYNEEIPDGTVLAQTPNYPAPIETSGKVNLTVATSEQPSAGDGGGGGGYGDKTISILCMLPLENNQMMKLTVEQDSVETLNQTIVPSERRIVTVPVAGDSGTKAVSVNLNGKVYMSYLVDFNGEKVTYTVTADNSADFQ